MPNKPRILIVEDDVISAAYLSDTLVGFGYEIAGRADNGESAISLALSEHPDVILLDIAFSGKMTGIQAAAEIHRQSDIPVIYLSAYSEEHLLQQVKNTDAYACLVKPVQVRELRASLEMAMYKHGVEKHIAHLNQVLRAVRDINQLLARGRDPNRLLEESCQILLRTRGYRSVWIGEPQEGRVRLRAWAGDGKEILEQILNSATPEEAANLASSIALSTGRIVISPDLHQDQAYAPWHNQIVQGEVSSGAAIPMICMGETFGVLVVFAEKAEFFDPEEVELLQDLAADIALGLKTLKEEYRSQRAAEVLLQSEERFSKAFRSNPAGMTISTAAEGRVIDVNESFLQIFGYTRAEVIDRTAMDLRLYSTAEGRSDLIGQLYEKGRIQNHEVQMRTRSGELRALLLWMDLISLAGESCVLTTLTDITERKRAENALQTSQQTLQLFVKYAPAAIAMFDREMVYLAASQRYLEDYRLGNQQLLGRSHYEIFPEIPERWREIHRRCLAGATERCDEDPFLRADGETDWVRWEIHPWHEQNGQIGGILLFSEVITGRKRAEELLKRRVSELEVLYENSLTISRLLEPEQIGEKLIEVLASKLDWHHAAVRTYHEKTGRVELLALGQPNLSKDELKVQVQRLNQLIDGPERGVTGWVIKNGQAVRSGDLRRDPRYIETFPGVISGLYIPIQAGGRVLGSISVESQVENAFSEDDERLMATLAYQAAIALENAQLYQTAQQEILERERASLELRVSEEKYRGLVESLDSVVAMFDAEGRCLFANEVAGRQLGREPGELVGKMMGELFPAPVALSQLHSVQRVIAENRALINESETILQGQKRWNRTAIQPIRDASGRAVQVVLNATDITEIKNAQHVLQEHNRLLEQRVQERTAEVEDLYNNAPCGYHSLDTNGRFVFINDTELAWLGYTRQEILSQPISMLLTAASREIFTGLFPEFVRGGSLNNVELEFVRKDGSILPVQVSATAIYDHSLIYLMSRSIVLDITERKKAEAELRQSEAHLRTNRDELSAANIALEKAARMKDDFLASMSHELRTPLTGILGLSEALQYQTYGPLSEKQLKALKDIESSGRHLLELINDILDLSKIEAGRLEMHLEPCSLNDICQASLQLVRGFAKVKRQQVSYRPSPEHIILQADGRRLKQILVNLLSNAIKFTPEGGELGLEVAAVQARQLVRITIWDKGIGIHDDDMGKLFQPFVQVDSSLSRQYSGTGLGLALVHRMVEMHGGSIELESHPDQGSRFGVLLPWSGEEGLPPSSPPSDFLTQRRALTIAQAGSESAAFSNILKSLGIVNTIAADRSPTLPAYLSDPPDLVFVDLDFTRDEAAAWIAELKSRDLAVVLLASEERYFSSPNLGEDSFLVKPVEPVSLRKEVMRLMAARLRPVLPTGTPGQVRRLALVDDNQVILDTLGDFLTSQGFEVSLSHSGTQLLETVAGWLPDLILMDIQMPGLDGLETTRRVRSHLDPAVARIPVVALTALVMPNDRERCLAAGANAYLSKPVYLPELLNLIRSLIKTAPSS